jgi:hypothetical protein
MARHRRPAAPPTPEPVAQTTASGARILPEDRYDPRALLGAPEDVQRDPAAMLAWAADRRLLLDPEASQALADRRAGREAWHALTVESQRLALRRWRGHPEHEPAKLPPREVWPYGPGTRRHEQEARRHREVAT